MIRTTRSRVFFLHVSTLQHRSWICLYMCIAIAHIDCSEAAPNNIATTLGATTTAPLAMFATRQNIDADTDDKVRATVTDTKLVPQFAALSRHTLSLGGNIRVDNVTRLHGGDVFQAYDTASCVTDTCVGLSSGTAGLFLKNDSNDTDARKYHQPDALDCRCQCSSHLRTFREDLNICVDDLHECTLASFVSGSTAEKIPFVFLPLRGQIIHPSKEITFQGVKPLCAVSAAQYMTTNGWTELRNPVDADVPFRLYRDERRTFLQWLGEAELRHKMQGRLVLVHLICREVSTELPGTSNSFSTGPTDHGYHSTYPPCVAFRVVGQPIKLTTNVTEVSFQPETQTTAITSTIIELSMNEYVAIAICSLILLLVYVASLLLYLYVKKRKNLRSSSVHRRDMVGFGSDPTQNSVSGIMNEQVIFSSGSCLNRSRANGAFGGQIRASNNFIGGDPRRESIIAAAASVLSPMSNTVGESSSEEPNVKNNPLLKHYPMLDGLSDFSGCDRTNSNADSTAENIPFQRIHHHMQHINDVGDSVDGKKLSVYELNGIDDDDEIDVDGVAMNANDNELIAGSVLKENGVSIVDDLNSNDNQENMKAIVNGTLRRKLYFNPAYFEPHLMMSPPAAAIEFLNKIREVISIAKYKMSSKRYQPSLIVIPEEGGHNPHHCQMHMRHTGENLQISCEESELLNQQQHYGRNTFEQMQCDKKEQFSSDPVAAPPCSKCTRECSTSQGANNVPDPSSLVGSNHRSSDCINCGDKRNSIRKWLEDISTHEGYNDRCRANLLDSIDQNENSIIEKLLDMPLPDDPNTMIIGSGVTSANNIHRPTDSCDSGSNTNTLRDSSLGNAKKKHTQAMAEKLLEPKSASIIDDQQSEIENRYIKYSTNPSSMESDTKNNSSQNKNYDKVELFTQIAKNTVVGEFFNNPQFRLHSTGVDAKINRQMPANVGYPVVCRPENEISSPNLDHDIIESLKQQMPDMIHEAMTNDYNKLKIITSLQQRQLPSDHSQSHLLIKHCHNSHYHSTRPPNNKKMYAATSAIPYPDYDYDNSSSLLRKNEDVPSYVHVPTPDYNTYGRSKNNPQPDSPIYKRKSPHHLIVDYETDSLERNSSTTATATRWQYSQNNSARKQQKLSNMTENLTTLMNSEANANILPLLEAASFENTITQSSNECGSSSIQSSSSKTGGSNQQASPSLSTALPLEEELTIHNTVYNRIDGFRRDEANITDGLISRISSFANCPDVGNRNVPRLTSKQPRIQYNTPSHGSMTIEVEHSPSEYEQSTDSEQFEPDTLDRKSANRRSSVSSTSGCQNLVGIGNSLWAHHLNISRAAGGMPSTAEMKVSCKLEHTFQCDMSSDNGLSFNQVDSEQLLAGKNSSRNSLHRNNFFEQSKLQKTPLLLRSSGSFKNSHENSLDTKKSTQSQRSFITGTEKVLKTNFNSLREIYEAKNQQQQHIHQRHSDTTSVVEFASVAAAERDEELGRLLTLEARHSRRQRQTAGRSTLKKPIPPDVVPTIQRMNGQHDVPLYDIVKNPPTRAPTTQISDIASSGANVHAVPSNSQQSTQPLAHIKQRVKENPMSSLPPPAHCSSHDCQNNHENSSMNSSTISKCSFRNKNDGNGGANFSSSESTEMTGIDSDSIATGQLHKDSTVFSESSVSEAGQSSAAAQSIIELQKCTNSLLVEDFSQIQIDGGADQSDFSDASTLKSDSTNFIYQSASGVEVRRKNRRAASETNDEEMNNIEISSSASHHSVPQNIDQQSKHLNRVASMHSDEHTDIHSPHRQSIGTNYNVEASSDHVQLLSDLTSPMNRFDYPHSKGMQTSLTSIPTKTSSLTSMREQQQQQELSSVSESAVTLPATKVFRCEVNTSSHGMQIALGLKDRMKKTKDLRYAWKRFVNAAMAKLPVSVGGGPTSPRSTLTKRSDRHRDGFHINDSDEGIASILDEGLIKQLDSAVDVGRPPGLRHSLPALGQLQPSGRHDLDSGYMSADSNESKLNSKRLYERFNFRESRMSLPPSIPTKATSADVCGLNRMQDIKEDTTSFEVDASNSVASPTTTLEHRKPSVTGFIAKKTDLFSLSDDTQFPINYLSMNFGNISDRNRRLIDAGNGENHLDNVDDVEDVEDVDDVDDVDDDDDDDNEDGVFGQELDDEMCGSGAESVETNSVFYKNVQSKSQLSKDRK